MLTAQEERKKKIEKDRIESEQNAAKEKVLKDASDATAAASAESSKALKPADAVSDTLESAAQDLSVADVKIDGAPLESVASVAIERGVALPPQSNNTDRPQSKQSSRKPNNDNDRGGRGGRGGREGRGGRDGKSEGRGGRSEGRGRGDSRENSGRGGHHRESSARPAAAPAVTAPAVPAPAPVPRTQVAINMNMIGKGTNNGRKAADANKEAAVAASAPVVKVRTYAHLISDNSRQLIILTSIHQLIKNRNLNHC